MILGIVGSRRRNNKKDYELIRDKVIELKPDKIVSGGCKTGADDFAEEIAAEFNIPIDIHLPKLPLKGSPYKEFVDAYHERNKIVASAINKLIAVVSKDRTGGTENTIKHFLQLNDKSNLILL